MGRAQSGDLDDLGLTPRAYNALCRAGLRSQQDLQDYLRRHGTLVTIPNIGAATEGEILAALPVTVQAVRNALERALHMVRLRGVHLRVDEDESRVLLTNDPSDGVGMIGIALYRPGGANGVTIAQLVLRRDLCVYPDDGSATDAPFKAVDAPAASIIHAAHAAVLYLVRYRLGERGD